MTHGGERQGAGRARVAVDMGRLLYLHKQGLSQHAIALKLGVSQITVSRRLNPDKVQPPKAKPKKKVVAVKLSRNSIFDVRS